MAHALWKGGINFGLVHIPIALHAAEKSTDEIDLHLLDSRDHARIRYTRVNERTGEAVDWDDIVKGYEYSKDEYVVLSREDLLEAAGETSRNVEIDRFVERKEIPAAYFAQPYYLVPLKGGEKGYVILREVLRKTGKAALARVALRLKQHTAVVYPEGPALMLVVIRYQDELRTEEETGLPVDDLKKVKTIDRELKVAEQLVASMSSKWEPSEYHDDQEERLREIVERKIAEKGTKKRRTKTAPRSDDQRAGKGKTIDMVELLKQSLAKKGAQGTRKRRTAKG